MYIHTYMFVYNIMLCHNIFNYVYMCVYIYIYVHMCLDIVVPYRSAALAVRRARL